MRRKNAAENKIARGRGAFTLVELLVVIAIVAVLVGLLMPMLGSARKQANRVQCLANIRSILQAIHMYADSNKGALVCGSAHPLQYPGQGPWLPINSLATFQFWLGLNQEVSGLGVLVEKGFFPSTALFCPTDADGDPTVECEKFNKHTAEDAWCSYLFRQLDGQADSPAMTKLVNLGNNAKGIPITALVMDIQCTMVWNGLPIKRNHDGTVCCIGFIDGSAMAFPNTDQNLTLLGSTGQVEQRLNKMLEYADWLGR